jgi:hypothetical protein
MTQASDSPDIIQFHGCFNGEPRTIEMDVRAQVARAALFEGRTLTDEELDAQSLRLKTDLLRMQNPKPAASPRRLPGIGRLIDVFKDVLKPKDNRSR